MVTVGGEHEAQSLLVEHVRSNGLDQPKSIVTIMDREPLRFHLHSDHAELELNYGHLQNYLGRLGSGLGTSTCRGVTLRQTSTCPWERSTGSTTNSFQHMPMLKSTGYDGTVTQEAFTPQMACLL